MLDRIHTARMSTALASWRTSLVAVALAAALAAYLLGYVSEAQLVVAIGALTALGKLVGADAAQVAALAAAVPAKPAPAQDPPGVAAP